MATWPGSAAAPGSPAAGGLEGRVALVTGGNRGIGRAAALGLARAGADVAIAARDAAVGAEACRDIRALRRQVEFLPCDVRSRERVEATMATVVERFGSLDILVTSAGVASEETPAEHTSAEEWARILDTNLTGAFLCCRAAGRRMLANGRGVIINIASVVPRPICRARSPTVQARQGWWHSPGGWRRNGGRMGCGWWQLPPDMCRRT